MTEPNGDRLPERLTLAKHGGLAGGMRLNAAPTVLETASLPESEADELRRLVAAARSAQSGPQGLARSAPDAMSYTITLDDDEAPSALQQSDASMSEEFAALLDWIDRHTAG